MALGDMFLKVEGSKQGPIKGEAQDEKHPSEIDVLGWSWGMRAQTTMGAAGASGKSTLMELQVSKRVDSATTGLMSAMRNNEPLKRVILTVRKAGKETLEYFKITLQQARITSLDVGSEGGGGETLNENVSFAFKTITVDYVPQGTEGAQRGGMSFETDVDRV
ncbi:MAG: type VI secretion system tube protein Hcp [Rhodocyclaceae bacterium]